MRLTLKAEPSERSLSSFHRIRPDGKGLSPKDRKERKLERNTKITRNSMQHLKTTMRMDLCLTANQKIGGGFSPCPGRPATENEEIANCHSLQFGLPESQGCLDKH